MQRQVVVSASDHELEQARRDATFVTEDLVPLVRAMELVLGPDPLGLGVVLLLDSKNRIVWTWRALLVPMLILRRARDRSGLSQRAWLCCEWR